jgi:acyl-coenzyme A thioesterase PaaI-like protein
MVCSHAILPRIPVTLDLEVQLVRPGHAGTTLDVVSRPVKLGRTVAVSDAQFFESSTGDLIATSLATFVASPDPSHVMPGGFPRSIPTRTALGVPLAERVQRRIIEPGVVEMPRLPDGQNATGAIQGGLLAFSAEEAALSLVDEPAILTMLNIRYFRPFSIGPARATATRNGRVCNVQLVDAGSGKTGAVVTSRWAPLNSPEVAGAP